MAQRRRNAPRARKARSQPRPEPPTLKAYLAGANTADEAGTISRAGAASTASHETAGSPPEPTEPWKLPTLPRETSTALAQVMLLFSASSLRHYAGLVETVGRYAPDLARTLEGEGISDEDSAERLRQCFREVADLSIEEAQRLRTHLEHLDRPPASSPATTGPHWRRWKAKP